MSVPNAHQMSPVPQYNSNEFYRQYKAINQTPPEQPHHLTAADYEIQRAPHVPTPEQQRRFAAMDYNRETNAWGVDGENLSGGHDRSNAYLVYIAAANDCHNWFIKFCFYHLRLIDWMKLWLIGI